MPTSLYDLSVPTFLQTIRAVGGFLDRAASHFSDTGVDADAFVTARLFEDMAPFHFQIEAAWHHSVWGVEALLTGAFIPPALVGPVPFADLQAMMGKAETALEAFVPEEINACAGKQLDLENGPRGSRSRRRISFCLSLCQISIFTLSRPTTSCARAACRSASAIMRAGCAPV